MSVELDFKKMFGSVGVEFQGKHRQKIIGLRKSDAWVSFLRSSESFTVLGSTNMSRLRRSDYDK